MTANSQKLTNYEVGGNVKETYRFNKGQFFRKVQQTFHIARRKYEGVSRVSVASTNKKVEIIYSYY